MDRKVAEFIVEQSVGMDFEVELYEGGYSGRCMFGKQTAAITYDRNDIVPALVHAAIQAAMLEGANEYCEDEERCEEVPVSSQKILEEAEKLRTDNLGLGMVAY